MSYLDLLATYPTYLCLYYILLKRNLQFLNNSILYYIDVEILIGGGGGRRVGFETRYALMNNLKAKY